MRRARDILVGFLAALVLVVALPTLAQMGAASSRVPTSIGEIKCQLQDTDGTTDAMEAHCQVDVLDAAGGIMRDPTFNVRDVGSVTVKQAVASLLNAVRAQAESEVLPE